MKFLEKSTQTPCQESEELKAQNVHMALPKPETEDEWRRYWNFRTEQETEQGEDGEASSVDVQRADYVAVQSETEPTDEEWTAILKEQGFTDSDIEKVLSSANV